MTIAAISRALRNREALTSPSFRFLADLYANAPKIMIGPAIIKLLAWEVDSKFVIPEINVTTPRTKAIVQQTSYFIFHPPDAFDGDPFWGYPLLCHTKLDQRVL